MREYDIDEIELDGNKRCETCGRRNTCNNSTKYHPMFGERWCGNWASVEDIRNEYKFIIPENVFMPISTNIEKPFKIKMEGHFIGEEKEMLKWAIYGLENHINVCYECIAELVDDFNICSLKDFKNSDMNNIDNMKEYLDDDLNSILENVQEITEYRKLMASYKKKVK